MEKSDEFTSIIQVNESRRKNVLYFIAFAIILLLYSSSEIRYYCNFDLIKLSDNIGLLKSIFIIISTFNCNIFVFILLYLHYNRKKEEKEFLQLVEFFTILHVIISLVLFFSVFVFLAAMVRNFLFGISIITVYISSSAFLIFKMLKFKKIVRKFFKHFYYFYLLVAAPYFFSIAIGFFRTDPDIASNQVSLVDFVPSIVEKEIEIEIQMSYDLDGVFASYKECRVSGRDQNDGVGYIEYKSFSSDKKMIFDRVLKHEIYDSASYEKMDYNFDGNTTIYIKDNAWFVNGKFILIKKTGKITFIETDITMGEREIELLAEIF